MNKYPQLESREAYQTFYEEQGAKSYSNAHLTKSHPRVEFLLSSLTSADYVLEFGCQDGGMTKFLAQYCKGVYVCDISSTYIERAKQYTAGLDNVQFEHCFAEDKEMSPVFDAVVAMEILEHVIAPEAIVLAAHSALRANGVLIVSVPIGWPNDIYEHVRQYTTQSLYALLSAYFSNVSISYHPGPKGWILAKAYK